MPELEIPRFYIVSCLTPVMVREYKLVEYVLDSPDMEHSVRRIDERWADILPWDGTDMDRKEITVDEDEYRRKGSQIPIQRIVNDIATYNNRQLTIIARTRPLGKTTARLKFLRTNENT